MPTPLACGRLSTPDSKVVNGKIYWLKFDFNGDGVADHNFEGSVASAAYYYAVWPSLKANSIEFGSWEHKRQTVMEHTEQRWKSRHRA